MMNRISRQKSNRTTRRQIANVLEALEPRRLLSTIFSAADLNNNWNVSGMKQTGAIQFDGAGNITGGSLSQDDGSNESPSGTYTLDSTGHLTIIDPINGPGPTGAMNVSKNLAAITNINEDNTLNVFVPAGDSSFVNTDLQGTWSLFLNGAGDSSQTSGHGTMTFDNAGGLTATFTADDSNVAEAPTGTYTFSPSGNINIAIDGALSFQGWMSPSRDVLVLNPTDLVSAATNHNTRMMVLVRSSGTYTVLDAKGVWNIELDHGQGTLNLNGAGGVLGTVNTSIGAGTVSGSYTVSSDGAFAMHVTTIDPHGTHIEDFAGAINGARDVMVLDKPNSGTNGVDDMIVAVNSGQDLPAATNFAPSIGSLTGAPNPVLRNGMLKLTAGNVADSDGSVKFVDFWIDNNNDGILETTGPDADKRLGRDTSGANGWSFSLRVPTSADAGDHVFFAVPTDNKGLAGTSAQTTVTINNSAPTVRSLVAAPRSFIQGKHLNLIVAGGKDTDGHVAQVSFYVDMNANGIIDLGIDTLLGSDSSAAGGWKFSPDTSTFPAGTFTIMAQATDNDGATSSTVATQITVLAAATDLTITSGDFIPKLFINANATAGSTVRFTAHARNNGNTASGAFSYQLILSANNTFGDSDDILIATASAASLNGGASRTDSHTYALNSLPDVGPGTYYFMLKIDSANSVVESDETNNVFISPTPSVVVMSG
jgi:hypothetical protein